MTDQRPDPGPSPETPGPPPGWYPDPLSGRRRWWDGTAWGAEAPAHQPGAELSPRPGAASQERTWALWSHLGPLLVFAGGVLLSAGALSMFTFVFPLVVMSTVGTRSLVVRAHAVESLNFQLSMMVYGALAVVVGLVLVVVTLGIGLLILVPVLVVFAVFELVVMTVAAVQASDGSFFRYPLTIRFVR